MSTYREMHEHRVSVATLADYADAGFYLNPSCDRYTGRMVQGYAVAVAAVEGDAGAVVVTLEDAGAGIAILSIIDPTGPAHATISRSYGVGESCAVCGAVVRELEAVFA